MKFDIFVILNWLKVFLVTIVKKNKNRQTILGNNQSYKDAIAAIFNANVVDVSELFLSKENTKENIDVYEQILYLSRIYNLRNIKTGKVTFGLWKKGFYGIVDCEDNADQNIRCIDFGDRPRQAFLNKKFSNRLRVSDANKIIVTHEVAHVITASFRNTNEPLSVAYWSELNRLWNSYKRQENQPKKDNLHISDYSFININEFHAEAFTEYHLSDEPSQMALAVGQLIDKYFKKETSSRNILDTVIDIN